MPHNRNIVFGLGAVMIMVTLTVAFFIWPNYRETAALRREADELYRKCEALEPQTVALARMKSQLTEAIDRIEQELKYIPESADLASLIRRLSMDVDRATVLDQTFTAGSPADVLGRSLDAKDKDAASDYHAMPLTVDMEATFESVFALIRNAESLNRLIRVVSVRMGVKRDDRSPTPEARSARLTQPVLKASIGLEAIYGAASTDHVIRQVAQPQSAPVTAIGSDR